jgi:Rod binding domain-containing protein
MNQQELKQEAKQLEKMITNELVKEFGKSLTEAESMVKEAKIYELVLENELALHESPHQWALSILTQRGDEEALGRYYNQ